MGQYECIESYEVDQVAVIKFVDDKVASVSGVLRITDYVVPREYHLAALPGFARVT